MSCCPVCNSLSINSDDDRYDDRYGCPGKFDLMRCRECGHAFLQHEFAPKQLTDLYSNYYPRSGFDLERYQPHQEEGGFGSWLDGARSSAFRWVSKSVRVLDIGCGFGESLGYHAARGCDVYGVEADENIRRVAEKFGYNVYVGLFDSEQYEPAFFDYITMDQVMEHVTDPVKTMQGVAQILKSGGKAILTVPNANGWGARVFGRKWINWHTPYHLQFYSKQSLRKLSEEAGLEIESVQTITASAWLHFQWLHLATYPDMEQPSGFWSPKALSTPKQKIIVKLISRTHLTKINHIITRFFDSLNMGDNLVLVLRKL